MAEKKVSVRLVAEGGRRVRAELEGVGEAGARGFGRLSQRNCSGPDRAPPGPVDVGAIGLQHLPPRLAVAVKIQRFVWTALNPLAVNQALAEKLVEIV